MTLNIELLTTLQGDELKGKRCLVTGGCGFLGSYLVKMILLAGAEFVTVLDARKSPLFSSLVPEDESRIKLVLCDIRDKEQVYKAVKGVDIVFHAAAYFGFPIFSSNFFGDHEKVLDINVNGTSNVLQACIDNEVTNLVYTSSVNVVFDGINPIIKGDEKLPYAASYLDPYGFAKAKAERDVIGTNGKHNIATVSLRPNGIYGPGEVNNVGRALQKFNSMGGVFFAVGTLGDGKAVSDWTYVENIAYSNIRAAMELLKDGTKSKIAGQCYNITDGVLYNNIEFFKDIAEECGLWYNPCILLPVCLMLPIAKAAELFCYLMRPLRPMQPVLTPLEIMKITTTHYFSSEKAKADLDFKPLPVDKCRELTRKFYVDWLKKQPRGNDRYVATLIIVLLIALFVTMFLRRVFPQY